MIQQDRSQRLRDAMRSSGLRLFRLLMIKGKMSPEMVLRFVFLSQVVVFHPHLLWGQTRQASAPTAGGPTIQGVVKFRHRTCRALFKTSTL